MSNAMLGGITRHIISIVAGIILATNAASSGSLNDAVQNLMNNIAKGDVNAIIGAALIVFAIIWSMWTKMTDASKQTVINALKFKK